MFWSRNKKNSFSFCTPKVLDFYPVINSDILNLPYFSMITYIVVIYGSAVAQTRDHRAAGSSLTGVTALCP